MNKVDYSKVTPEICNLSELCKKNMRIDSSLYAKYDVKRGLRDINGKGVLAGLTDISDIRSSVEENGVSKPIDGQLFYRGINIIDIVEGCTKEQRFGFEEVTYLLLFGELPTEQQLKDFTDLLSSYRTLPQSFVRDIIMKAPSPDMMNILARGVLTLYAYDSNADDISPENVLRQCLQLIATFPLISVYGYNAYEHYFGGKSLFIHAPDPNMSTAENILHLLRSSGTYSGLEAKVLDLALILHAEHGGGNNSTFACRVLSSSGTDTFSAIAAGIGSLKGPRHGGANIKVVQMLDCIKANVKDCNDDEEIKAFLQKIVNKEAGDGSGLIYGMGHAVYTLSDPRAVILKENARKLVKEKGFEVDFKLLDAVERLSPEILLGKNPGKTAICANVDLYSGLVYRMLDIPEDLYTPLFAVARMAGWCAHRIEEVTSCKRIIRPAYRPILEGVKYVPLSERKDD